MPSPSPILSSSSTTTTTTTSSSSSTLLEPKMAARPERKEDPLEVSLHTLPKPLLREFRHVFAENYLNLQMEEDNTMNDNTSIPSPNNNNNNDNNNNTDMMNVDNHNHNQNHNLELLAIPTNQQARQDLVAVGDEIEQEKDRLLNVFLEFGKEICEKLRGMGYWADYIDPCSGLPMMTRNCNKVYSEVDGMECMLHYKAYNAGFCKVLTHPKWGSAVYPATIFAHAPRDPVMKLLQEYYV